MSKPLAFRLNLAFEAFESDGINPVIAHYLRAVANRIEAGDRFDTYRNILDINGNVVGQFALKPHDQL